MASAALKNLVSGPITPQMIGKFFSLFVLLLTRKDNFCLKFSFSSFLAYITKKAASVIPCDPPLTQLNMSTTQPQNIGDDDQQPLPPLHAFIQRLVAKSNVSTATFLTTIV